MTQVSKPVTVEELLEKDKDDESLKRYKESLLGAAAAGGGTVLRTAQGFISPLFFVAAVVADDGDPRNVIIDSISIVVKDRPDIVIPLTTPADVAAMKGRILKFKEGVEYSARFRFRVRRQIVTGLKFLQVVYKLKLPGGPNAVPHSYAD
jgi:Rho GDP-dissociation inhibitor